MKNTRKKNRNKGKTRTKKIKGGLGETFFPPLSTKIIKNNAGIENLKDEITDIKSNIKPKKDAINAKRGEIDAKHVEIDAKQGEIDAKQGEIDAIKGEIKIETGENAKNEMKLDLTEFEKEKKELVDALNGFIVEKKALIVEKNNLENDEEYKKKLDKLNKKENELIAKNRNKAVLDNNAESNENDLLIDKTKKNLVIYLQKENPKSTEKFESKDFVDLVNLATEKGKNLKQIINETRTTAGDKDITPDEYEKINKRQK